MNEYVHLHSVLRGAMTLIRTIGSLCLCNGPYHRPYDRRYSLDQGGLDNVTLQKLIKSKFHYLCLVRQNLLKTRSPTSC